MDATKIARGCHLSQQCYSTLQFIHSWTSAHRYAPTIREVGDGLGLSSSGTVHNRLSLMRELGVIDWIDGEARTLHLTDLGDVTLAQPGTAIVTP